MEELRRIFLAHISRYPLMQPADAVKLIYQNEFGSGHMIPSQEACLNYLRREYDSTEKDPSLPLWEDIGNGVVRVNLAAVKPEDLATLGRDFIRTAAEHTGSMEAFMKKLEVLRQLTEERIFTFGPQELTAYLLEYRKASYPMVSHSEIYKANYAPAYRIVLSRASELLSDLSK